MSQKRHFEKGMIYHVYARGNNKQTVFHDDQDYRYYLKKLVEYAAKSKISVINFCLMSNHTHICCRQDSEIPLPKFMQRLNISYAMYFNNKYQTVGHIFQGNYNFKYVQSDYYLTYLSFYIHLNPYKIGNTAPELYPYSSLKEYYSGQGQICNTEPIMAQFNFVKQDYIDSIEAIKQDRNKFFEEFDTKK